MKAEAHCALLWMGVVKSGIEEEEKHEGMSAELLSHEALGTDFKASDGVLAEMGQRAGGAGAEGLLRASAGAVPARQREVEVMERHVRAAAARAEAVVNLEARAATAEVEARRARVTEEVWGRARGVLVGAVGGGREVGYQSSGELGWRGLGGKGGGAAVAGDGGGI